MGLKDLNKIYIKGLNKMKKFNEAINQCLQTIGEQTLDNNEAIEGIYEAEQASTTIDNVKVEFLSEGWSFNTENSRPYLPDTEGYIVIPEVVLRIDVDNARPNDGKLYNLTTKSYIFTSKVYADVIFDIDFDDLPILAQQYIVSKASRILYQRLVGDVNMFNYLIQDERDLMLKLREYEADIDDANIFDDASVSRAITRTSNPTGLRG